MNWIRPAVVAVILIACLFGAFLWYVSPEVKEETYPTYREAFTGDEVKDSWIPDLLPPSATDIWVRSSISPSFIILEFRFALADANELTRGLRAVESPEEIERAHAWARGWAWRKTLNRDARVYLSPASAMTRNRPGPLLFLDPQERYAWYGVD